MFNGSFLGRPVEGVLAVKNPYKVFQPEKTNRRSSNRRRPADGPLSLDNFTEGLLAMKGTYRRSPSRRKPCFRSSSRRSPIEGLPTLKDPYKVFMPSKTYGGYFSRTRPVEAS